MSIYLTGASGFVGKNLISYFNNKIEIKKHDRDEEFCISQNIVIHLAGKAHDFNNNINIYITVLVRLIYTFSVIPWYHLRNPT